MRPLSVLFTITITFIFSGCVASQSPQIANIDKPGLCNRKSA